MRLTNHQQFQFLLKKYIQADGLLREDIVAYATLMRVTTNNNEADIVLMCNNEAEVRVLRKAIKDLLGYCNMLQHVKIDPTLNRFEFRHYLAKLQVAHNNYQPYVRERQFRGRRPLFIAAELS